MVTDAEKELEQKRLAARQAMEGPEWTAKREREEKEKKISETGEQLKKSLAEIDQKKTAMELEWVKLDDQRKIVRAQLAPILEREKQAESAEASLELEEAKTVLTQDKQVIEKKRQVAQITRQEAEKEKWGYQEKLWQIERVIETNTVKYRALLDQEDEAKKQLNELHV
ncbi:MAG: hypothetical protein AAB677_00180 [Patescibacteria group bacterium]